MYKTLNIIKEIDLSEYIQNYRNKDRFIALCKECNRYNSCWACPPFNFDIENYILNLTKAYIIGTKIILSEYYIKTNNSEKECTNTAFELIKKIRKVLDNELLNLEYQFPDSKVFYAGTCYLCNECRKTEGKPCDFPEKVRPSLEAFGFDVCKTSSKILGVEMKWRKNGVLPKYFMLVSGIFTNQSINKKLLTPSIIF